MIIATENLSKEYDGVYRVQDLDIRVKEGDIAFGRSDQSENHF